MNNNDISRPFWESWTMKVAGLGNRGHLFPLQAEQAIARNTDEEMRTRIGCTLHFTLQSFQEVSPANQGSTDTPLEQTIHMVSTPYAQHHGRSYRSNPKYLSKAQSIASFVLSHMNSDPANQIFPMGKIQDTLNRE
ncbi:hypothetical protein Tco_1019533 [Tanacetum coccineum]|uniref:Uncharacterized protein n=1 Tax=Tanacetum coccineum TaxID=301880 RepID=A0ABQ5FXF2_9ASTR